MSDAELNEYIFLEDRSYFASNQHQTHNMQRTTLKSIFIVLLIFTWTYSLMAQDVLENHVYKVTAYKQGNNQVSSTSNYAEVIPPVSIYIPNAFTPNGDGINDSFGVKGEGIRNFHLYIYNRWGEKIFETTNPKQQWDGLFAGQPAEQGSYVVQVYAQGLAKSARNATVTLVR